MASRLYVYLFVFLLSGFSHAETISIQMHKALLLEDMNRSLTLCGKWQSEGLMPIKRNGTV